MKTQHLIIMAFIIIAGVFLTANESHGQVDVAWLNSWNEAQKNRPEALNSTARIAQENEPGVDFYIHGQVFKPNGEAAAGVVVQAYHRDREGFEFGPKDKTTATWRLQGWARTNAEGRFEFQTIRPAADQLGREGAHIHFTIESMEFGRQWVRSVFLSDDPLVSTEQRRRSEKAGMFGRVREVVTVDGIQRIDVNIQLKDEADF